MLMTDKNEVVADVLKQISEMYTLDENNPGAVHKSRAFRDAADTIRYLDIEISQVRDPRDIH